MNELGVDFMPVGWLTYFITLTYTNWSVPYITKRDLESGLPIIRRAYTFKKNGVVLNTVLEDFSSYSTKWYPSIDISQYKNSAYIIKKGTGKKYPALCDCVAVLYMRDFQLFFKRLNKKISSYYGYKQFRFFVSYEFGENTYRPHAHILLSSPIPSEILKSYIMSCWPYCDFNELDRHLSRYKFNGQPRSWFELALRPAKYVSTYVCDGFSLPPFYKLPFWRQKKCHSLYYGFNNPSFSLHSVYLSAREKNLSYIREYFDEKNQYHVDNILIPSYVINRYFPKIKRYAWLHYDEFFRLCESISRNFSRSYRFSGASKVFSREKLLNGELCFSYKDCETFKYLEYKNGDILNLVNICWRMYLFALVLGISFYDYLILYQSVYVTISSQHLIKLHENDFNFLSTFRNYTNLDFLLTKIGVTSSVSDLIFSDSLGVVQTSKVLDFCNSWKDPNRAVLLRQFADNKHIKKCNSTLNPFYKLIKYGI